MSIIKEANRKFCEMYNVLDKDNLERISEFYADDIRFIDPYHEVNGIVAFGEYFAQMYANITSIRFDFAEASYGENIFHQDWVMVYSHPKINKGQPVSVPGCSRVRINEAGLITEHQDYFDSATMLYKQLPVIGSAINFISNRMVS